MKTISDTNGDDINMLELKNVSYSAGEENGGVKDILTDVSLQVSERFVAITGPNGGGKSTLAKLVAGIIKPTSGSIWFDGQDITDLGITEEGPKDEIMPKLMCDNGACGRLTAV